MNQHRIAALRQTRAIESRSREDDYRSAFQRDYARLIHSPAFRRLQGKSQVFGAGSGDYYRTRLTHTLEVAQIARQLARKLSGWSNDQDFRQPGLVIDPEVVECAAIAHDLGHPPFGHTGERILDKLLINHGYRFEANAQNFRILCFLEKRAAAGEANGGLNLTAAVLLATNKYPGSLEAEGPEAADNFKSAAQLTSKGLYPAEWRTIHKFRDSWEIPSGKATLEAQLMDLSDDIAYSTHDLEDGIRAGKIQLSRLREGSQDHRRLVVAIAAELREEQKKPKNKRLWPPDVRLEALVTKVLRSFVTEWERIGQTCNDEASSTRRELKASYVHKFTTSVGVIARDGWYDVTFMNRTGEDVDMRREMAILKQLAWIILAQDFRVKRHEKRGERIVESLWTILSDESVGKKLLPFDWVQRFDSSDDTWSWSRLVADYIAGCTDSYAETLFGELTGSGKLGSLYEID
jgi:dGTPase